MEGQQEAGTTQSARQQTIQESIQLLIPQLQEQILKMFRQELQQYQLGTREEIRQEVRQQMRQIRQQHEDQIQLLTARLEKLERFEDAPAEARPGETTNWQGCYMRNQPRLGGKNTEQVKTYRHYVGTAHHNSWTSSRNRAPTFGNGTTQKQGEWNRFQGNTRRAPRERWAYQQSNYRTRKEHMQKMGKDSEIEEDRRRGQLNKEIYNEQITQLRARLTQLERGRNAPEKTRGQDTETNLNQIKDLSYPEGENEMGSFIEQAEAIYQNITEEERDMFMILMKDRCGACTWLDGRKIRETQSWQQLGDVLKDDKSRGDNKPDRKIEAGESNLEENGDENNDEKKK